MSVADNYDGREYPTGRELMCTARTEVFSRVVGFYRPVQQFNPGKTEEFKDRQEYAINMVTASDKTATVH